MPTYSTSFCIYELKQLEKINIKFTFYGDAMCFAKTRLSYIQINRINCGRYEANRCKKSECLRFTKCVHDLSTNKTSKALA